jgi:hypothetical protein
MGHADAALTPVLFCPSTRDSSEPNTTPPFGCPIITYVVLGVVSKLPSSLHGPLHHHSLGKSYQVWNTTRLPKAGRKENDVQLNVL